MGTDLEAKHLETLNPDQQSTFEPFRLWINDPEDLESRLLTGMGGTGKTYAISKLLLATGFPLEKVIGLAPTNDAKNQLALSFEKTGVLFPCYTVHKGLSLVPQIPKWTKQDDYSFAFYKNELDRDDLSINTRKTYAEQIQYLNEIKAAIRNEDLLFIPGADPLIAGSKLCIVDEASMIDKDIYKALTSFCLDNKIKILYMGDNAQLPPVNEKFPKAFELNNDGTFTNRLLGRLTISERNTGELSKVCEELHKLADSNSTDFRTAKTLLSTLPVWEGQEEGAYVVTRPLLKEALSRWSNAYTHDGFEFRAIARTNKKVLAMAGAIRKYLNPNNYGWKEGDKVIVNQGLTRAISRYCFSNLASEKDVFEVMGKKNWKEIPLAVTSSRGVLTKVNSVNTIDVMGTKLQTLTGLVNLDDPSLIENFMEKGVDMVYMKPSYRFHDKMDQVPLDGELDVKLINPNQWGTYFNILDQWKNFKNCFFSGKNNRPSTGEKADQLFEFFDIPGWGSVPGTPGRKKFKVGSLTEIGNQNLRFLEADDKEVHTYDDLRKKIIRYYYWVKSLSDEIRPPTSVTVHKAQGQTIERVALHLEDIGACANYDASTAVKLAYTGASRTSKLLLVLP